MYWFTSQITVFSITFSCFTESETTFQFNVILNQLNTGSKLHPSEYLMLHTKLWIFLASKKYSIFIQNVSPSSQFLRVVINSFLTVRICFIMLNYKSVQKMITRMKLFDMQDYYLIIIRFSIHLIFMS